MKVVENSPQNARNCTIFKNFARNMPLRSMYTQNLRNWKVGPPLRNPTYAPVKSPVYFAYRTLIACVYSSNVHAIA